MHGTLANMVNCARVSPVEVGNMKRVDFKRCVFACMRYLAGTHVLAPLRCRTRNRKTRKLTLIHI